MASMQEYLESKSDEELRVILRSYIMGTQDFPADVVLYICKVLARRDETLPDPDALFLGLCRMYS